MRTDLPMPVAFRRALSGTCNASETCVGHHACVSDTALRLRATSDALLRDLEALTALEEEKRALPATDPRLADLARRVYEIAGRVLQRTADQQALTERAAAAPPAVADPPIDDVLRSPAAILAEWRAAEQRANVIDPATPEGAELRILATRLREEYREAFERRRIG
jgi:hypothetical protein